MYIYGKNVIDDTIKNKNIKKAYIYINSKEYDIINYLKSKNINISFKEKYELDNMVNGLHQGIILDVEDYKYCDLSDLLSIDNPLIVILDHLEDPHNYKNM